MKLQCAKRTPFTSITLSEESDSFPKQIMLSRLLDIISGDYKESQYLYSPTRQLDETYAKLGLVTQIPVAVQKVGISYIVEWKKNAKYGAA